VGVKAWLVGRTFSVEGMKLFDKRLKIWLTLGKTFDCGAF